MNMRTTLLAAALVLAMAPTVGAEPYGTNCSDPSTYDTVANGGTHDDVQCLTIAGPGSATHKSILGAGIGICTTEAGSPIPCNDPSAPAAGVGAAIFDASSWIGNELFVRTWVGYNGDGFCGPGITCGFDVLLCNDIDFDGICTNVSAQNDQLFSTQSNEPIVGEDCSNKDKDLKDCPDPTDAEIGGCMTPAMEPPAPGPWNNGQIVVFIGNWVDSWPGTPGFPLNIGAGVAVGTFDVWLAMDEPCPPECDDGFDNDGDGYTDHPADPGCSSATDDDETSQCDDGIDNDMDTFTDFSINPLVGDPQCTDNGDDNESA